jgi:dihydroorotate dehydrogenase (fumarate)
MDLATRYLGLELRNPLVASASNLSNTVDGVRRLADAGVGAVVLYSLLEEQLRWQADENAERAQAEAGSQRFTEPAPRLPEAADEDNEPRRYLNLLERAAAAVDIPVIASLNGVTLGLWTDYATTLEQAGAAAVELNVYDLPGDELFPGRDIELRHVEILTTIKAVATIPVAVKMSPYYSSIGEMALRLDQAGADGLVLFHRFIQPDIDPDTLTVTVKHSLSSPVEARLPRAWIALLAGRVSASLAATTGVDGPADVAAYLLAGADAVMTASALLRYGVEHVGALLDGLSSWMASKGFTSLADVRGLLSVPADTDREAYERASYVTALRAANMTSPSDWTIPPIGL